MAEQVQVAGLNDIQTSLQGLVKAVYSLQQALVSTPVGSDTEIQYNAGDSSFGSSANFTWNYTTNILGVTGSLYLVGNVVSDTSTGIKIGTAANQKLGFWGVTPIVQPTTAIASAAFVQNSGNSVNDSSTFDGYTIKQIVKALRNIGALE